MGRVGPVSINLEKDIQRDFNVKLKLPTVWSLVRLNGFIGWPDYILMAMVCRQEGTVGIVFKQVIKLSYNVLQ
jgi:hypothetical protein